MITLSSGVGTNDAEAALHNRFADRRVNRVNLSREYFVVTLGEIRTIQEATVFITKVRHTMRPDLTDITLVIDRSGSMQAIRSDSEGGVNAFVAEQAQQPGEALLTLVQFDTEYEFVHRGVPVPQVPPYRLEPRGSTALLDAVGGAILDRGARLETMAEEDRPGLVVFVIVTDGEENSSTEFSKDKIKEMITHQQDKYSWHFTFLGANQDAFAEAGGLGIHAGGTANYAMQNVVAAHAMMGKKLSRMRAQRKSNETVRNEFTDEEREQMS